jgi:hypothetical protein
MKYWWIAVNGCSATPCPYSQALAEDDFTVSPTPEVLIGLTTEAEQLSVAKFLLKGRLDKVRMYMQNLPNKAKAGKLKLIEFKNPEKAREQTGWIIKQGKAGAE